MEMAHEGMIWSLAWHPLGHILCSGSNDHTRYCVCVPVCVCGGPCVWGSLCVCRSTWMSEWILIVVFGLCFSKFWTRNRPGDKMRDRYNLNLLPGMSEDGMEYGERGAPPPSGVCRCDVNPAAHVPLVVFQMTWT